MGLLEKIFGKKDKEEKAGKKQLSLGQARELLEKRKQEEEKELEKAIIPKFSEISSIIKESLGALDAMEKIDFEAEGENKFLRKIVQSSKEEFVQKMKGLLERTRAPERGNFEQGFEYCKNAFREYQQEISGFRKNIAYTGILAKNEMKAFAKGIESMEKELAELEEKARKSKWQQASMLLEKIGGVEGLEKKAGELKARAAEIEKDSRELEEKRKKVEERRKGLQEGERFKELEKKNSEKERLEAEKALVKEKALNILAPLEKQLRKMQALAASKEWMLEKESERMLNSYLQDCFNALKQDPKGEILKQVLQEMRKAIDAGKIAFKEEKEKAKKMQAAKELEEYDFFNNFFWKLNEIEKQLPGLSAEIQNDTLFKEIAEASSQMQSIEREKAQKDKEEIAVKERKDGAESEIAVELGKISEIAQKELFNEEWEIKRSAD